MMTYKPFSVREGLAPESETVDLEEVPNWVREDAIERIKDWAVHYDDILPFSVFSDELFRRFKPLISKVMGRDAPRNPMGGGFQFYIPTVIEDCEWWRFYDICEMIIRFANSRYGEEPAKHLQTILNELLAAEGMQWEIRAGIVVPRRAKLITRDIEHAEKLLTRSGFEGPNAQFAKAVGHMSKRPEPNTENCIKDAVGAVEGTVLLITGNKSGTLSKLLKSESVKKNVHPTIIGALNKIYAYRGDEDGVAHAMIDPEGAGREEAEWVLGVSASTIVYLIGKFASKA